VVVGENAFSSRLFLFAATSCLKAAREKRENFFISFVIAFLSPLSSSCKSFRLRDHLRLTSFAQIESSWFACGGGLQPRSHRRKFLQWLHLWKVLEIAAREMHERYTEPCGSIRYSLTRVHWGNFSSIHPSSLGVASLPAKTSWEKLIRSRRGCSECGSADLIKSFSQQILLPRWFNSCQKRFKCFVLKALLCSPSSWTWIVALANWNWAW
jgi:hypothetical protein